MTARAEDRTAEASEGDRPSARPARSLVLVLVLVAIAASWATRANEGRRALAASDAAGARGDLVEAIVLARSAAEARCPWCTAPELGYARLAAIAKAAEGRGDDATAVASWRAVRAATLATITLDGSVSRRERADAEIARLEHRIDAAAAAGGGTASPAATEERLRIALAASTVPSATVFALLAFGGALLLFGALRFVRARTLTVIDLATAFAGGGLALLALSSF